MPLPDDPVPRPHRRGQGTMDDAHEARAQRVRGAALFGADVRLARSSGRLPACARLPRRPNGLAPQTTPPKRSGGLGNPTALAEVDRGLPDGLKLVPNLGIGVQIGLYLSADLIPGLAFEAGEEVVHVGVEG